MPLKRLEKIRPHRAPVSKNLKELCRALLTLTSLDECESFLIDLCTPEELRSLSERWRVCRLLEAGDFPYRKIQEMTGVSTATITRVARAFFHGQKGYRKTLVRYKQSLAPKKAKTL